jgi:hypothetical protein
MHYWPEVTYKKKENKKRGKTLPLMPWGSVHISGVGGGGSFKMFYLKMLCSANFRLL